VVLACGLFWLSTGPALAAPGPAPAATLDEVAIEAVEAYPGQTRSEFLLGIGMYPFNAYFNSFAFELGYEYSVSRTFTWELLNFSYLYSIDKGLTATLADTWGVNPTLIERPIYMASSHGVFHFAYGKFVAFDQKIRYFKLGLLLGGGVIGTTQSTIPSGNFGLRFDVYVNNSFSAKLEVRNALGLTGGMQNFLTFFLGGGISL
jgi:hypothetical protein